MASPKVTDKRVKTDSRKVVAFVTQIAQAQDVRVTGDFSNWSNEGVALKKGESNSWSAELKLAPGEYQYRLIVDGRWEDDPTAKKTAPNPFGSQNGILTVS